MNQNTETIQALRGAAHEIRHLRKTIVEVKAEAWDVHSEVIKRVFSGSQTMGICAAHQADELAKRLEGSDLNVVGDEKIRPELPHERMARELRGLADVAGCQRMHPLAETLLDMANQVEAGK